MGKTTVLVCNHYLVIIIELVTSRPYLQILEYNCITSAPQHI